MSAEPALRQIIEAKLLPDETVVAGMTSDIDHERFYRPTLLVLTTRRFLSCSAASGSQDWSLDNIDKLKTKDRAGLGTLELLGFDQRLAVWHYTIAQGPAALVLGDRFEDIKANRTTLKRDD